MIDQVRIGGFLRELRKERKLTQEELAERFGVSSRSVSRWENGSTLPDLGMLVELADFYDVDINEIIAGEMKREIVEKETKDTFRRMADYADAEKKMAVRRKCLAVGLSTAMAALGIVIAVLLFPKLPEGHLLRSNGLWLGVGVTGAVLLWSMVFYYSRKERKNAEKSSSDSQE